MQYVLHTQQSAYAYACAVCEPARLPIINTPLVKKHGSLKQMEAGLQCALEHCCSNWPCSLHLEQSSEYWPLSVQIRKVSHENGEQQVIPNLKTLHYKRTSLETYKETERSTRVLNRDFATLCFNCLLFGTYLDFGWALMFLVQLRIRNQKKVSNIQQNKK